MTAWEQNVERQREARERLGLRGVFPYPVWWHIGKHRVKATTPTEAWSIILSTPIEAQIAWYA